MAGQVDDGELRRVGTRNPRSIAKQKVETGCVLVKWMVTGSTISTVYSRIKYIWLMNNKIIGY